MTHLACRNYLPRLIDAHEWAVAHGWDGDPLEPVERDGLDRALDRISHHTAFANTMINILLMNIGEQRIDPANFDKFSMAGEVTQLLDSYPFKGTDREKIVWKPENDFIFFGSDLLMRHVFINLLKNGLRALGEARQGHIEIRLEVGPAFQPGLLPRYRDRDRRGSATAPVRAVLHRPPRWDQGRHRAHLLPACDRKLRRHAHLPLRTRQIHRVRHQPPPNRSRGGFGNGRIETVKSLGHGPTYGPRFVGCAVAPHAAQVPAIVMPSIRTVGASMP